MYISGKYVVMWWGGNLEKKTNYETNLGLIICHLPRRQNGFLWEENLNPLDSKDE